jgi:hypothetical protein
MKEEHKVSIGKPRGTSNFEHRNRHIMREYFNGPYRHTFRESEMDSFG